MKTINLFFDFEFTSLSPDAQPISLGIIANEYGILNIEYSKKGMEIAREHLDSFGVFIPGMKNDDISCDLNILDWDKYKEFIKNTDYKGKYPIIHFINSCLNKTATGGDLTIKDGKKIINPKSFYAEFSDFDINRCDNWVKENVISKLWMDYGHDTVFYNDNRWDCYGSRNYIKQMLSGYLNWFEDYQIQFICDCGTFDWYWMLQLLAVWDKPIRELKIEANNIPVGFDFEEFKKSWETFNGVIPIKGKFKPVPCYKTGLPQLPDNISPVSQDLNDLIALKKGISIREAFELNREELAFGWYKNQEKIAASEPPFTGQYDKHNARWDAKIIKEIYQKL